MAAFPQVKPPTGQNVEITLSNGSQFIASFDGLQWWIGVPDEPEDVPVVNEFVVSWQHTT